MGKKCYNYEYEEGRIARATEADVEFAGELVTSKVVVNTVKQLNDYISQRFKVKGTNAYRQYWNLLCECVEWNGYVISTFINTLRSVSRRILNFIETVLWDCIIEAFANEYKGVKNGGTIC